MMPVSVEELSAAFRERALAYLAENPRGFAATVKPRLGQDGDQWFVLHGRDLQSGVAGFGPTIKAAYKSWEANYREATTAQQ